jgi:3'(2'), 5'-bisphosphate nucleotidase
MLNLERPETRFAIDVVRQASKLVRMVQEQVTSASITKEDYSPVTVADFASQALVGKVLADRFPNHSLVAEENAADLRSSQAASTLEQVTEFVSRFQPQSTPDKVCDWIDRGAREPAREFWTLDPVDGTKGFLRGDQYAIALALIVDGQVQIGVLGCPNISDGYQPNPGGKGTLAVAVRGEGAWQTAIESEGDDFEPLLVSDNKLPERARLLRSFESGHTNVGQMDYFAEQLAVEVPPVRMDSQAKYLLLAAGEGELYLRFLSSKQPHYKEKIWDQAAGSLIVEEAGGMVSDLHGKPLDFSKGRTLLNNRGVLASNGYLHQRALQALQVIQA